MFSSLGSSLSPILADMYYKILRRRLYEDWILTFPFTTDMLTGPHRMIDNVLKVFNSFHNRIQFTLEIRGDNLIF